MDLSDLRQSYTKGSFSESDLLDSPFEQFEKWFREAEKCDLVEPNAMCLATADANGLPSTRVVLLKDFSSKGLTFYTNYQSRKAAQLEANPQAAANFLWLPLQRQVNVIGRVERVSKAESLKYFLSRPFGSQLGAWASPQSQVITSRSILEMKLDQMKRKFAEGKVPLPDHWGGYRIVPESFEFWQGRTSRLHDRFIYQRDEAGQWRAERLAP
ncbi:pyridoxamine 5'-phosphate oxidase [Coraliomargarita sp. W4R53]